MKNSYISWTNDTLNFWMGCQKISQGCRACYMHRLMEIWGKNPNQVTRVSDKAFYSALSWTDPRMIFTCSMSDFFIEEADPWRNDAWAVIEKTPQHRWQVLTKRSSRIIQCLPRNWGNGYRNVWLGVSAEDQENIFRIEDLANTPAKVRFISFEPLLGPIDLSPLVANGVMDKIHWGIIGGESGNASGKYRYRPCEIQWMEDLVNQLKGLGIKVFVNQLGTYQAKRLNLRDKKGSMLEEWPESLNSLRIQEFPV